MAAATESASVGGSVCTSVIIPPVTQCDHTLPPSPALPLTNTPIPTPTSALTIDAESLQDVLTETQLSVNTDTAGPKTRAAMVDGSNYSVDMQTEVSSYDNPNSIELKSVDPPCGVLGDDPGNCWQITDVHTLGCQEQTEWGRNAGHSVSNTTDVCEQKEQVADEKNPSSCVTAGAQLQQPQPPSGEGGPHLDTGQGGMSATPRVSEAQKLLIRSSHQPWPFLSLKTSTPCTSSSLNTNFAELFQTSVEPNLKSGHIDHNLKPLQITSNFEDKRNPSRAAFRFSDSFGVVRFQNGSQQTNQTSHQTTPNAPLQTKSVRHFDGKQTSVSSLNTNYFLNDINNSDTLFFDLESKQNIIKDNHPAVSTSFDGSLRNMQSHSAHTSNTCQDFDNTSLENSQPSLSVEQYLFDLKDLPEFANIPTEDDVGGDMFELTPTIPFNALPSCSWQPQQAWYNYTATSTTKPETMAITAQSLMGTATSCSSGSYSQVTSVQYHASPNTVDHIPASFSQGSSSSKMAVNGIPATVNATGPDTCPSKTVDQTPMIWTQSMDSDSQPSLGLPHRLDPVQEALVSALGADMHMSLSEMHSCSNNCQDSNLFPTNPIVHAATGTVNSTSGCMHKGVNDEMGYTSALLSPPVTPCPEKESGYATTDDQEASSASFSWEQYDGGHGGDLDGSYTTYTRQAYVGSENGGMGGGGHFQGHYPRHDSHHYSVNHAGVTDVSRNNNSVYYPFNDLMQLNPSLPGDQEPSVHNIHHPYPHSDPHGYPSHTQPLPPSQQVTPKTGRKRRQGRGRGRSQDVIARVQIQSDQITSSLLGQQQMQAGVVAKRTYKRRNSSIENLPRRKSTSKAKPGVGALEAETNGKKSRHNEPLNQKAVVIMNEWYSQNEENPYPTKEEKDLMAADGGITTMQVKSWFANKRNRSNNTRPKVQKRAMEEKLMQICRKAAGHATDGDNSFIIKELSQIIHTFDKDVGSSMASPDPGDEDDE